MAHVEAVAIEPERTRAEWPAALLRRLALTALVLAALWALWELYRWLWITTGWTHPFVVDDLTMPHIARHRPPALRPGRVRAAGADPRPAPQVRVHDARGARRLRDRRGRRLRDRRRLLHTSRLLRRGFLPYVVASQTIPILAIAPMVVIWGGSIGLPVWLRVGLIARVLTFFPVTINTIRGLDSAEPRALELMRSYAAGPWRRSGR